MGSFQHEPLLGSRVSYTSPTSSKASTPFPEALAAMGYCQIAQNCQMGLQTHLASRKQSREHRQRASGNALLGCWGDTATREGHLVSILRPSTALLEPTAVLGTPVAGPPQLGLQGAGHWAGHSGGCETGSGGGTVPRPRLKSMPPAPQESR